MKICTKCKIEKELSEFSKDKSRKDKLFPQCKKCALHYHNSHKKQQNKKSLDYHHKHKELLNDNAKQWRENNSQKVSEYNKIYRTQHIKERHINNKKWYKDNRAYVQNNRKNRRVYDINYKIKCLLRNRIRSAIKSNSKSASTKILLGCTVKFLKKYLESQFTEGMNWNNHGVHGWHIDHVKPCASFDLSKESEQRKCFHYTNLQSLWAEDNLQKSDKH